MDKFLLAENPMRPDSGHWIVHMIDPRAIIQCTEGHVYKGPFYRHYQYGNSDGIIEEYTLSIFHPFTQDFTTKQNEIWEALLNRAWRWYRSYLEFEDENIDRNEQASDN